MLRGDLIHPSILKVLGSAGHGSGILIADGNYPFISRANPAAERVYLNLAPGLLSVTDILKPLLTAIPIEAAHVMVADNGAVPIHQEFAAMLPDIELQSHKRFPFYDLCKGDDVALVIASGEQRIYANILLIIGVVKPT
ncbi:MAG: RbsD/FucU family protein [Anaerolineae bacterium]|nr:RbsD/FucU family protein [Anaerolineae bacterium]